MSEPGFTLQIELGNSEMNTGAHIAQALREVAEKIETMHLDGPIHDVNGNHVGSFKHVPAEPPYEFYKACNLEAGQWVKVGDDSYFQRLEIDPAPMPGGRVELILEPHSEGFLIDAAEQVPVRIEDA